MEFFLRAPFSRSRKYWWSEKQIRLYSALAPAWMKERRYDACIRDTAMSGLFASRVHARTRILRLNDNPDGLTDHIHPMVVRNLKDQIRARHFAEIWPTTSEMLSKIGGLGSSIPAVRIPNGVFLDRFHGVRADERRALSAVYVGTFNGWFDVELLNRAAQCLEEWQIDLHGPYSRRLRPLEAQRNVTYRGPLAFDRIPETLARYRVGLIPFGGQQAILETIDPLKANQYLASGLGIASTSHGNLGIGLRQFARFGDDPVSFAAAVRDAGQDCLEGRKRNAVEAYLQGVSWSVIMDVVEDRLRQLVGSV